MRAGGPYSGVVAFRSEREADRHRIDALEDEVEAKDDEIQRLRAELEAQKAGKKRKKKRKKRGRGVEGQVPAVADLPEGDVMVVPTHDAMAVAIGALWLAAVVAVAVYGLVTGGFDRSAWIGVVIFGVPPLFLVARSELVCDRRAGTITVVHSLIFRFSRRIHARGKTLVVERRLHQPKDGDSYWAGHLFVGDRRIARDKIAPATALARRVAAFMGMPLAERHQSQRDIMRAAQMPLIVTMVVMVAGVLLFVLAKLFTQ